MSAVLVTESQVLIGITGVFYILTLLIYFHRRNKFPIAQRFPYFVIAELVLLGCTGLINLLVVALPDAVSTISNCQVYMGVIVVGEAVAIPAMSFRLMLIFTKDLATKIMCENDEFFRGSVTGARNAYPVKDYAAASPIFRFLKCTLSSVLGRVPAHQFVAVLVAPVGIICVIDCFMVLGRPFNPDLGTFHMTCHEQIIQLSVELQGVMFVYIGILSSFAIMSIWNLNDNFSMGKELRALIVLIIILVAMLLSLIDGNAFETLSIQSRLWQFTFGSLVIPIVFMIQLVFPIVLSIRHAKAQQDFRQRLNRMEEPSTTAHMDEDTCTSALDIHETFTGEERLRILESVIENEQGRHLLMNFLEAEFAVENLFFIESCHQFEKECALISQKSGDKMVQKVFDQVKMIKETFLDESAPNAVNLPDRIRRPLLKTLGQILSPQQKLSSLVIDPKLFEDAVREIKLLLVRESFSRFRMSAQYAQYLQQKELSMKSKTTGNTLFRIPSPTQLVSSWTNRKLE
eukprot:TRINITY_DN28866_c0_g2_i1.p1 TRINITY_DN28866_c0_g2~~TRINITY_DN28866_c0_g2_i1.p1  ORF type:complete len:540 (-),score=98.13 TRINITY_DN28866_c0_g2_i1:8-1555(-)